MVRCNVAEIKAKYPVGSRVQLIYMDDQWAPPGGTEGTVTHIDDAGQVHVAWDNGSSLALIPGLDTFIPI